MESNLNFYDRDLIHYAGPSTISAKQLGTRKREIAVIISGRRGSDLILGHYTNEKRNSWKIISPDHLPVVKLLETLGPFSLGVTARGGTGNAGGRGFY